MDICWGGSQICKNWQICADGEIMINCHAEPVVKPEMCPLCGTVADNLQFQAQQVNNYVCASHQGSPDEECITKWWHFLSSQQIVRVLWHLGRLETLFQNKRAFPLWLGWFGHVSKAVALWCRTKQPIQFGPWSDLFALSVAPSLDMFCPVTGAKRSQGLVPLCSVVFTQQNMRETFAQMSMNYFTSSHNWDTWGTDVRV